MKSQLVEKCSDTRGTNSRHVGGWAAAMVLQCRPERTNSKWVRSGKATRPVPPPVADGIALRVSHTFGRLERDVIPAAAAVTAAADVHSSTHCCYQFLILQQLPQFLDLLWSRHWISRLRSPNKMAESKLLSVIFSLSLSLVVSECVYVPKFVVKIQPCQSILLSLSPFCRIFCGFNHGVINRIQLPVW